VKNVDIDNARAKCTRKLIVYHRGGDNDLKQIATVAVKNERDHKLSKTEMINTRSEVKREMRIRLKAELL